MFVYGGCLEGASSPFQTTNDRCRPYPANNADAPAQMDDGKQPHFTLPSTTTRPGRKVHAKCTGGNFATSIFGACFGTHWFTNGNVKKIGEVNVLYTEKKGGTRYKIASGSHRKQQNNPGGGGSPRPLPFFLTTLIFSCLQPCTLSTIGADSVVNRQTRPDVGWCE